MTMTSIGFNGSVNDKAWARIARLIGERACTERVGDLPIAQVSTQRQITLGTNVNDSGTTKRSAIWRDGVLTTLDAPETVTLPTPTNAGNWYLLALTRTWNATGGTVAWNVRTGPSSVGVNWEPPTSYPATFVDNPGTQADVPVAWIWLTNQANVMTIVPLLTPARSLGRSGTAAQRDAMFAQAMPTVASNYYGISAQAFVLSPAIFGEWFNSSTLCTERFDPAIMPSSNPLVASGSVEYPIGIGNNVPSWYPVGGDLPAVVADGAIGGTAPVLTVPNNTTAPTAITFSPTNVLVARGFKYNPATGVFTCPYTGRYRFGGTFRHNLASNADVRLYLQQLANGSRGTGQATIGIIGGGGAIGQGGTFPDVYMQAGDQVIVGINNGTTTASTTINTGQRMVSAAYLGI